MATCVLLTLCASSAVLGDPLPTIEGQDLDGEHVSLPEAVKGHSAVLIVGFTHASQNETKAWSERIRHDIALDIRPPVYSVAVIEDAPRLVRGMIIRGLKNGTARDQWDHFLVVTQREKELKQAAGFDRPDDAYILLLDPSGSMIWRFHGPRNESAIAELRERLH